MSERLFTEDDARKQADGHLTIFAFTTEWKAVCETPAPENYLQFRAILERLPGFATREEAVDWAARHPNALTEIEAETAGMDLDRYLDEAPVKHPTT
jgi:muconolactone delta-isomerase